MNKNTILSLVVLSAVLCQISIARADTVDEELVLDPPTVEMAIAPDGFFSGPELDIDFGIDAKGLPTNSAGIHLRFDPRFLQVKAIDYGGSFCTLSAEQTINNRRGILRLGCGTPNGQITGRAKVARVTFTKIKDGRTDLSLSRTSKILANDGYGTNMLFDFPTYRLQIQK